MNMNKHMLQRLCVMEEQSTSLFLALSNFIPSTRVSNATSSTQLASFEGKGRTPKQKVDKGKAGHKGDANGGEEAWKPPEKLFPLADIGLNLTDEMFDGVYGGKVKHESDKSLMLERADLCGVRKMMLTGGDLESSRQVLEAARTDVEGRMFSTVGTHPTRCDEFDKSGDPDAYYESLLALCQDGQKDGKVVAIGEFGLDYDRLQFCSKVGPVILRAS
jgi:hypothetical protein